MEGYADEHTGGWWNVSPWISLGVAVIGAKATLSLYKHAARLLRLLAHRVSTLRFRQGIEDEHRSTRFP
jgi:hypothetical protein